VAVVKAVPTMPHEPFSSVGQAASAGTFRPSPNQQRLPAGPLLSAVGSYATRRQLSLELLLNEAARRTLSWGRQSGELTLNAIEKLCEPLGLHPRELYGDAYDRAAFTYVACRQEPTRLRERSRWGGER
jgi:hypothetical protein